jgi:REP element-mobilizing transposase RayT
MANPAPLEWGQTYHIYSRGNNRENVFFEERNYPYFLRLYGEHIQPIAETYAYCLMRNHFHLLIRVRDQEEVAAIQGQSAANRKPSQCYSNLLNAYTRSVNQSHGRTGSLFERPFGRKLVTADSYLSWLVIYIHCNPQKHRFVADFREWPYSSYHSLLAAKPTRLRREEVLAWFGGVAGFVALHGEGGDERRIASLVEEDFD